MATESDIERQFGESFTRELMALPPGAWGGPLYSGLGVHLVMVTERLEGRLPELAEVRSQVERDYQVERRQELKDKTYKQLRTGYEIVVESPAKATGRPGEVIAGSRPKENKP
jgi:parvulin-like peptidyl-prolyl isomerase